MANFHLDLVQGSGAHPDTLDKAQRCRKRGKIPAFAGSAPRSQYKLRDQDFTWLSVSAVKEHLPLPLELTRPCDVTPTKDGFDLDTDCLEESKSCMEHDCLLAPSFPNLEANSDSQDLHVCITDLSVVSPCGSTFIPRPLVGLG